MLEFPVDDAAGVINDRLQSTMHFAAKRALNIAKFLHGEASVQVAVYEPVFRCLRGGQFIFSDESLKSVLCQPLFGKAQPLIHDGHDFIACKRLLDLRLPFEVDPEIWTGAYVTIP